ncbi:AraC family transcriptional regulator [Mesorhizobium sp. B2-4-17]|uniref:helix-turn-helix domain-containing protein n=1 Tax=Mesorhizobium sp. B2-4-17 TaxID=2589932 RepID=UPI00112BA9EF|nr:AraC family transcriptional regulator [Mesorhizobium sp. B2-4-17]TPK78150.1 helix-turn-helix transcriptional regulator [Mesorhizobium sp. B2-4-17]
MELKEGQARRQKDFFRVRAPLGSVEDVMLRQPGSRVTSQSVVLDLQRRKQPATTLRVDGELIPIMLYPAAHQCLVRLATAPCATENPPGKTIDVLLLRRTFDRIADAHGVPRINKLDVKPGAATMDPVMRHLGSCLDRALDGAHAGVAIVVDRIADALNLHIAQRYGGLGLPRLADRGGLAPWQLRRARNLLDSHLDGSLSLGSLARECGLSPSHFSRAFAQSTGFAPHRWLMRRRVEIAKDLMRSEGMSLAQIAVACGFVDQSHFSRTFTGVTGMTPGRWRKSREFPLDQEASWLS